MVYPLLQNQLQALGLSDEKPPDADSWRKLLQEMRQSESRYLGLYAEVTRKTQELELLSEVRTLMARELDVAQLMRIVVETIAEKFGYTHVSLYLLKDDTLVLQYAYGYDHVITEIPISTTIAGRVVREKKPVLVEDVSKDNDFVEVIGNTTAEICVPLFAQQNVAGVFIIESQESTKLTTEDLHLLVALSEHISIALERAQLHTELRETNEHYQAVINNLSEVIFQADLNGNLTFINSAWTTLTGYKPEECLGKSLLDFVHPDDREMTFQNGQQVMANNQTTGRFQARTLRKDGSTYPSEASFRLMRSQTGELLYILGTSVDISERVQIEQQSIELQGQKRAVEALKNYLVWVSHDFRTPLSIMNTSLYLIRRKYGDCLINCHHLDVIQEQITHLTNIVDDTVSIQHLDEDIRVFEMSPMDMNGLVGDLLNRMQPLVQAQHHQLTVAIPTRPLPARGDYVLLQQAIRNLITNALRYTQPGGVIKVETGTKNNSIFVEVADNGIGIAEENLPHIFERFYRADKSRSTNTGGIGLGLSIAKSIIERHNGKITVASTLGQGSIFTIWLPTTG